MALGELGDKKTELEQLSQQIQAQQQNTDASVNEARQHLHRLHAQIESLKSSEVLTAKQIERLQMQHQQSADRIAELENKLHYSLSPLDDEKMQLEQNIQMALAQQTIELEDAIQIRLLDNPKAANYYLVSAQKKRRKERMDEARQNSEMQMQQAVQAAQAKSQGELQLEQAKAQFKLQQYEEELESDKERETLKYFNILRVKTLEKLLEQGTPIEEMPSFIFDGIEGVVQTQKQLIAEELMDQQKQDMQQQQEDASFAQQSSMVFDPTRRQRLLQCDYQSFQQR
jgi:hypothetical protein